MEKQLNVIDGDWGFRGGFECLPIPVYLPPGDTQNVSSKQFVDSPLSVWPAPNQTGSIFWTLGIRHMRCGHQCVIQTPCLNSHTATEECCFLLLVFWLFLLAWLSLCSSLFQIESHFWPPLSNGSIHLRWGHNERKIPLGMFRSKSPHFTATLSIKENCQHHMKKSSVHTKR